MRAWLVAAVFVAQSALAADSDVVLLKAKVLFIDPERMQPQFECPQSDDPKAEIICMRSPRSYTIDIRDVLIGNGLARRLHAILWIHTEPPSEVFFNWKANLLRPR